MVEATEHVRDPSDDPRKAPAESVGAPGCPEFIGSDAIDLLSREQLEHMRFSSTDRMRRYHEKAIGILRWRTPVDRIFIEAVKRLDDMPEKPDQIIAELADLTVGHRRMVRRGAQRKRRTLGVSLPRVLWSVRRSFVLRSVAWASLSSYSLS